MENKVPVMTIHSAKGLEFDAVLIPGFEERFLPHEKSTDKGGQRHKRRTAAPLCGLYPGSKKAFPVLQPQPENLRPGNRKKNLPVLQEISPKLIQYFSEGSFTGDGNGPQESMDDNYLKKLKQLIH